MTQTTNTKHKHVYLVGKKGEGYRGYTYSKKDLEGFLKLRKKFSSKKVKTKKVYEHIHMSDEIVETYPGVYLLGHEEEYFLESFGYYLSDTIRKFHSMTDRIKLLKVDDDEQVYIDAVNDFIKNIIKLKEMEDYTDYDYDEFNMDSIINYPEAQKYFIKNTLDALL